MKIPSPVFGGGKGGGGKITHLHNSSDYLANQLWIAQVPKLVFFPERPAKSKKASQLALQSLSSINV
jgi:hypothetical protein